MSKVINCPCGFVVNAETDDQLVAKGPENNNVDKALSQSYRMLDDQVCEKDS